jgi:hypothetical protein
LQRQRQIYYAFLAPFGPDGVAKFVLRVGGPAHHRVGEPESKCRRLIHRPGIAAENRLDLVLGHAGFQRHVDDQLRAGAAIFGQGADDLGGETRVDRDHLAVGGRLHEGRELEEG